MTRTQEKGRPLRVGLISLGCAKNLVDAEIMLGSLMKDGVEITNDPASADAVIVNTCSFIDSAQEESVDAILESAEVRDAKNRGQALIVSGCLPQRFRNELPTLLPEVDAFMGIDQVSQVSEVVDRALRHRDEKLSQNEQLPQRRSKVLGRLKQLDKQAEHSGEASRDQAPSGAPLLEVNLRPNYIPDFSTPRFRLTPKHFAYVKIAEGCNHPCSFCIIPRMRGSHRSRAQADVIREARQLIESGVKEINLISQDSTYYGLDLRADRRHGISSPEKFRAASASLPAGAITLATLLEELNALDGDFWVRLLYTHPAHWTDDLIRTISRCKKVARYVDMPLQHIHQNMLERMRRETSQEYIVDLIRRIRAGIPGIALRTTFIVGFPGETEECFETLLEFIRTTKFERMGVFAYSKEEGTRAGKMEQQIPDRLKQRRRERAMAVQKQIARTVSESFVGRNIRVLVEGAATGRALQNVRSWENALARGSASSEVPVGGRFLMARSEADAPDIDGRVYVRGRLVAGEFANVRIIGHTDYDLIAEK